MRNFSIYSTLEDDCILGDPTRVIGCRVPPDIVELVMKQLASAGSFWALRQCSLVCKDFAAICQKHIFTDVVLSNKGGFEGNIRTFPALASFRKALNNKPHLEGYVRVVDYCHNFDFHSRWPPVLRRLQHIHSLRIWFLAKEPMSWSRTNPSFKLSFLRLVRINRITHLDLYLIPDLPTYIFALVPCLEVLKIRNVTLHNNPPFVQESPPKLRSLHLYCNSDQLVHTLIASQNRIVDLSTLKHLEIDMGGDAALMGVIRDLLQQSEALEFLKFEGSLPELDLNDNLAKYLTEKSLQHLKGIELIINLWETEDDPYLNLISELEKLSGRNILEYLLVLVTVPIYSTCNTEILRWAELDRVLTQRSAFPCLCRIQVAVRVIYFFDTDRNKEMERNLASICDEAFPGLKGNEKIKFSVTLDIVPLD